jgi:protein TonB
MNKEFFKDLTYRSKRGRKWYYFPLSLFFHLVIIGILIVGPIVNANDNLPQVNLLNVLLSVPEGPKAPSPPPARRRGGRLGRRDREVKEKASLRAQTENAFVAPIEIPEEIPEEDFSGWDLFQGSDNGVDYGVEGLEPEDAADFFRSFNTTTQNKGIARSIVKSPRLIKKVIPLYPDLAKKSRVKGQVQIEAVTDIYGRVKIARVVYGNPLLREAALKAVKQWIYEPYIINGLPRAVTFSVTITFDLY